MTRDNIVKINSDIARDLVDPCAEFCPNAALGRTVNPVNSVFPAMAELYNNKGLDPMKIVGITTLDVVWTSRGTGCPAPNEKAINKLKECLTGCHRIRNQAGMPIPPGITREDLFDNSSDIARSGGSVGRFLPKRRMWQDSQPGQQRVSRDGSIQ